MNNAALSAAHRISAAKSALVKREPLAAVAHLKQVLVAPPRNSEAAELLGVAQSQAGDRPAALEAFRLATELEPSRATAHSTVAYQLSQDEDSPDHAISDNIVTPLINPDYAQPLALQETLVRRIWVRAWRSEEYFAVSQSDDVVLWHRSRGTSIKL